MSERAFCVGGACEWSGRQSTGVGKRMEAAGSLCLVEFTSLSQFCVGRNRNKDVNRLDLYLLE